MGAAAAEANRTLFVGNLDPRVTEELVFELFHQAGPVIKVKIPKDKDGKPKQFAFVNFKHEESVPYGMNLLNGIKLFGRPIKIQFRSGSSHASQDGNSSYSLHGTANSNPSSLPHSTPNSNSRYDRSTDNMLATRFTSMQMLQRSLSSPDNLQRKAMNSGMWQQSQYSGKYGSPPSDQSNYTSPGQQHSHLFHQSSGSQMQRRPDGSSAQRKNRLNCHPYQTDSRHLNREQRFGDYGSDHYRGSRDEYGYEDRSHDLGSDHYSRGSRDEYSYEDKSHDLGSDHYSRGSRDEYSYEDRSHDSWSHDYNRRDGKWRPSRH